jgi:glycosyltransferase involved in cell wall biosynthesis
MALQGLRQTDCDAGPSKVSLPTPSSRPLLSVVVCVYNDWRALEYCLRSLLHQKDAPSFEVLVIDDGSSQPVPDSLRQSKLNFPIQFIRENHGGVATARNVGIRAASGEVFVFTDADCVLDTDCLHRLWEGMANNPRDNCFQLRLKGDPSHLVGRAVELHLSTMQLQMLTPSGHIRYLNTAGCAIRRSRTAEDGVLFDPRAVRAQDTLLLADLILSDECPLFVPEAIVKHDVRLRVGRYMWKALRTGYVGGRTYTIIRTLGVSIRADAPQRVRILLSMLNHSLKKSSGIAPLVIVITRQCLGHLGAALYRCIAPLRRDVAFRSGLNRSASEGLQLEDQLQVSVTGRR